MEKIEVIARWDDPQEPSPLQFSWQGTMYSIETTGRQWNDAIGLHILCSVKDRGIFELIYQGDQGWYLDHRPPKRDYV